MMTEELRGEERACSIERQAICGTGEAEASPKKRLFRDDWKPSHH